jgi:hypothetical protein
MVRKTAYQAEVMPDRVEMAKQLFIDGHEIHVFPKARRIVCVRWQQLIPDTYSNGFQTPRDRAGAPTVHSQHYDDAWFHSVYALAGWNAHYWCTRL